MGRRRHAPVASRRALAEPRRACHVAVLALRRWHGKSACSLVFVHVAMTRTLRLLHGPTRCASTSCLCSSSTSRSAAAVARVDRHVGSDDMVSRLHWSVLHCLLRCFQMFPIVGKVTFACSLKVTPRLLRRALLSVFHRPVLCTNLLAEVDVAWLLPLPECALRSHG
jgi:hypothetical protein